MMLYSLNDVKRIHASRCILDIDRLEIEEQKIYTLIGPNGAGKTSLLSILAFLDTPNEGSVSFNGKAVAFQEKHLFKIRKNVVLVDQYPILFSGPVWKNIDFGLKLRRINKTDREKDIQKALDMVGMQKFVTADAGKLSGGETKRVALARALAIRPKVLLCDEPTANVDKENQEIILEILERCNQEDKLSLIFATHYLSQAHRLSDHTLLLQNGKLVGSGGKNSYVASCVSVKEGTGVWKLGETNFLHLPVEERLSRTRSRLVLDPNKIEIQSAKEYIANTSTNTNNRWSGRVKKLEHLNGKIEIELDVGLELHVSLSSSAYSKNPLYINEEVSATIPENSVTFSKA